MEPTSEEIQKAYSILLNSMVNMGCCYYNSYQLEREHIGNLPISSGKIQIRDPFSKMDHRQPLLTNFPIGVFPVHLGIANKVKKEANDTVIKYSAFAYICFSEGPVSHWEPALFTPRQNTINDEPIMTFTSDMAFAMYMDMAHAASYEEIYKRNRDRIIDIMLCHNPPPKKHTCCSLQDLGIEGIITLFSTNDSGSFISFIGRNDEGRICYLVTDLEILEPYIE